MKKDPTLKQIQIVPTTGEDWAILRKFMVRPKRLKGWQGWYTVTYRGPKLTAATAVSAKRNGYGFIKEGIPFRNNN